MRIIHALPALLLLASPSGAEDHILSEGPFSYARIQDAIAAAQMDGVPEYSASAPHPQERGAVEKTITVSRNGTPILAYRPRLYGADAWMPNLTFSCGPDQTVDITQVLFGYWDGKLPPETAKLALSMKPYGQAELIMPVTVVETLQVPRALIRLHGRIPATDPFLRNMQPTTNFQVQLMVDGRYDTLADGGDLSAFDTDIRPLLDLCAGSPAGGNEPGPAPARPDPEIAFASTPNASQIKAALEQRVAGHLAMYDGMADQCNTFQRNDNPLGAMACMMSGFGMASSQNMGVTIHQIDMGECISAQDGTAYCRYRVNAEMSGQGVMGQVAEFANLGLAAGAWSYSSFDRVGGEWSVVRSFDHCSWGNGEINCTYRE